MRWWKKETVEQEERHYESGFLLDWGFLKIDLSCHKNYYVDNKVNPKDMRETGEEADPLPQK